MFAHYFHHDQLRRYLIAFGQFFNNLELRRYDRAGAEVQRLLVPLSYGPKERWLSRLLQDPNFLQGVQQILPRLSYEMSHIGYDSQRKLKTLNNLRFVNDDNTTLSRVYVGVPYKLAFDLSLLTKTQEDATQVIEQILPYFTPDLAFAMKPIPDCELTDVIPIVLQNVTETDNYEGDFLKRRAIVWSLTFDMKVMFYGPLRNQKRITEVDVNLYDGSPLSSLLDPPDFLENEMTGVLELETGAGLLNETTSNVYLNTSRVAEIVVTAAPNQEPSPTANIVANTVITEFPE
jgi:hypothetical protein